MRVTYVSRIVGCPDQANECYPMCIHHNTPAGVRIVPLWQADAIRLDDDEHRPLRGHLAAVPTKAVLRLSRDRRQACCIDSCSPPAVVEDISLNGTRLTKVVATACRQGSRRRSSSP